MIVIVKQAEPIIFTIALDEVIDGSVYLIINSHRISKRTHGNLFDRAAWASRRVSRCVGAKETWPIMLVKGLMLVFLAADENIFRGKCAHPPATPLDQRCNRREYSSVCASRWYASFSPCPLNPIPPLFASASLYLDLSCSRCFTREHHSSQKRGLQLEAAPIAPTNTSADTPTAFIETLAR